MTTPSCRHSFAAKDGVALFWIAAALSVCDSLCGQTGMGPALEFDEGAKLTMTVQELRHAVPRGARSEMERADEAKLKHQPKQEIDHLKRAIQIDPEYVAARNRLGIRLFAIEPASAIAQWEEGIKVDPHRGALFANLAAGYLLIGKPEPAERAARTAVDLEKTSNQARTLLGFALYEEHKYTAEALVLVERASDRFPEAHLFAARMLLEWREFDKARIRIQSYVSSGDKENLGEASEMLGFIEKAQRPGAAR